MDAQAIVAAAEALVQTEAERDRCPRCHHAYALHRRLGSCMGVLFGHDSDGGVIEVPCRCMAPGPLGMEVA
jgi:hypothetical protein